MSSHKKNYKFEPKDFGQNSKTKMLGGAAMGDEQIIMFNEKEIQEKLNNLLRQVTQQQEQ